MDLGHNTASSAATPNVLRPMLIITDAHQACRTMVATRVAATSAEVGLCQVPPEAKTIVAYLRQEASAVLLLSCCDGSLHPLALLADVRGQLPQARVIVLTDARGLSFEHCAGRLRPDAVVRSIVEVGPAVAFITGPALPELRRAGRPLTPRESEVVQHVAEGMRNAEIAELIGIAEKTVKVNLTNIYGKLGIRSRLELAALAPQLLTMTPRQRAAGM